LLHLPTSDRSHLAARLIDSLDQEEEPGLREEWLAEIGQRARYLDEGKTTPVSASPLASKNGIWLNRER
jgi:putative addiction module component (TIGR02574 family)